MAKGFKTGGGGGAPLNFKVVGGTSAPSNPKENTIWLNTTVEIAGWHFGPTEPENPAKGIVWICTGVYSPTPFNALKKNGIQVHPILAKQYAYGVWVMQEPKIYQGGAWRDWFDGVIFRNGAKNDHITGGWNGYTSGSVLTVNKSNNPSTKNSIDLTGFKKVYVTFASVTLAVDNASYGIRCALMSASGTELATVGAKAAGTFSADISSIDGPVTINCLAHTYNNGGSGTISAIWFE